MLNKFKVFLFSIYFYLPTVLAEEVLYCVGDIGSGVWKPNGTWQTTDLRPQRVTIKFTGGYTKVKFFGHEMACHEFEDGSIYCNDKYSR